MLRQLKNIWRPENFHLHHMAGRGRSCFEGWYFKLVDAEGEQPYAIIPGVFLGPDAHAFIQVLDGRAGTSAYHRFALSEFSADGETFDVHIGRSHFSGSGISLDIEADETSSRQLTRGAISFADWSSWPVTPTSPGVMGPYSFAPFMECKHGILSMDHALSGELSVAAEKTSFAGGRGYIEKDWGRSFPSAYVWAQSNHFDEEGISISASVARIPWLRGSFRGYLVGFLFRGRLYRFTTYTGAEIEHIEVDEHHYRLTVRDQEYRLELSASKSAGAVLRAPYEKQMLERVAETMTSRVEVRLQDIAGGKTLFEGCGEHGCLEVQGDLDAILQT
ncbi:MAG: tocopherol cyclase family protein [Halieaceae bacterium]